MLQSQRLANDRQLAGTAMPEQLWIEAVPFEGRNSCPNLTHAGMLGSRHNQ